MSGWGAPPTDKSLSLFSSVCFLFAICFIIIYGFVKSVSHRPDENLHPNFKIGDVVQLKSGGPPMVVKQTNCNSKLCSVEAIWVSEKDGNNKFQGDSNLFKKFEGSQKIYDFSPKN